jgi:hypothetical protein
VNIAA